MIANCDVFLISIDCLRPDYVGCYNPTCSHTPIIDQIAADAAIFTQAVSHAPFTTPAVASFLTGLYPLHTGVRLLLGQLCEPGLTTVAESARRVGLVTAGFPSNFILNSPTGLGRGFDVFRDVHDGIDGGRGGCWQTGDRLNAALDEFLSDAGRQRVFCWLHYFDLHDYHVDKSVPIETSYPRDLRERIDRDCMGGFREVLQRHKRWDEAAIIMTADHGECLFQHGQRGHGHHLYDSVLRVPLIWKWPDLTSGGTRIWPQVRHVDIVPTLLDLWQIPPDQWPSALDGRSLVPMLQGEQLGRASSYAEASPRQLFKGDITAVRQFEGPELQCIRTDSHKLIVNEDGSRELYDLRADPLEKRNIVESSPETVDDLGRELQQLAEGDLRFAGAEVNPEDEALVVQRLRDLGYVA